MAKISLDEAVVILAPHMSYHPSCPMATQPRQGCIRAARLNRLRSLHTACTESQPSSVEVLQGRVLDNEYPKPHDAKETKRQAKQLLDKVLMDGSNSICTGYLQRDTSQRRLIGEGYWD